MEVAFRSEDRFTPDQFRDWLDALPAAAVGRFELVNGRIVVTPPAGWAHAIVEASLCGLVGAHVAEHRVGVVLGSSAGFDLALGAKRRDTLQPDLSFVATDRWEAGHAARSGTRGFLSLAPNLVVEILSPSTARRDRGEKKRAYARAGVDEYWIVDAERREVTVHVRGGRWFDDGTVVRDGIVPSRTLPGLALTVGALFAGLG